MKLLGIKKNTGLFNRLISDHAPVLYRHALWMTGNRAVAEDVVQETFFQAWRSIQSLQDETRALAWLLTILRRSVYREQRTDYRRQDMHDQLAVFCEGCSQDDTQQLLILHRALDTISPSHREIFLLHHLHGFSYEEISEQLEIPKGTVMSRLSRARDALKTSEALEFNPSIIDLHKARKRKTTDG